MTCYFETKKAIIIEGRTITVDLLGTMNLERSRIALNAQSNDCAVYDAISLADKKKHNGVAILVIGCLACVKQLEVQYNFS